MPRHTSYDEDLARELQDPEFASEFVLSLMEGEDGMDLLEAIKHTIVRMGVREFADQSDIHPKSVSRFLANPAVPKFETLDRYLAVFGLEMALQPKKVA